MTRTCATTTAVSIALTRVFGLRAASKEVT
ncbi:hypothetical protein BH10ACT11_BH10ACT11_08150 [soil metagenome]